MRDIYRFCQAFRRENHAMGWASLILVAAVASACSKSSSTAPTGSAKLTVIVTAPSGVTPNVTVTGPKGYSQSFAATTTLTALDAGSYTITATGGTAGRIADPIVSTIDTTLVYGTPTTLRAGSNDTAAVYYTRPGTGMLWVISSNNPVRAQGYPSAQLQAANTTPTITINFTTPTGVNDFANQGFGAVDAAGDLWLANYSADYMQEYSPRQLAASVNTILPVDQFVVNGENGNPHGVAFDAQGNMWVLNDSFHNDVEEYTASAIAVGSPYPAVLVGGRDSVRSMAFDAQGNIWVAEAPPLADVVQFSTAQLAANGNPTPAIRIRPSAGAFSSPTGLAFDAAGDLWVADSAGTTVMEYTPSQLAATGSPTPTVTIGGLTNPVTIAFDNTGNLWVGQKTSVVEFAVAQIATSGSPAPTLTLASSGPTTLVFDPTPTGLPLAAGAGALRGPVIGRTSRP